MLTSQEHNFGTKEFTLGLWFKIWKQIWSNVEVAMLKPRDWSHKLTLLSGERDAEGKVGDGTIHVGLHKGPRPKNSKIEQSYYLRTKVWFQRNLQ